MANARSAPGEFRERYRESVTALALPNIYFIDGQELLPDVSGLTVDMIDPGDLGMITIGERLAARIAAVGRKYEAV